MPWKLPASPPGSPPAIWAAFARQGAWKDWVIVALLCLNALTIVAGARLARREPDVVLVAADGKSTYLPRELAGDALARFLAEQRQLPSDVTVIHFTREFLQLVLALNSSTVDGAWTDALALMAPSLRERVAADAAGKKLLDSYRAAKVRTSLSIEAVELVERTSSLLHVRATVRRKVGSLLVGSDGPTTDDRLVVELVERIVPRTSSRPDGLEVAEMRIGPAGGNAHAP
jgi:hypothetical protein